MEELKTVVTHEDAIKLANEINRLDSALKQLKDELKKYVKEHGSVDTGQEVWDFYESVSWKFDKEGLKEVARNIALEGMDPWELLNINKTNLNKLGWDDDFIGSLGTKKVTKRFTSRKNRKK